eukprot:CAMPEP_0194047640 /NCGR_PEP_ID=MMETSP0009_2-20130614/25089_1 /TAXON_ID=210454 /ORGANISM="Grammatophora oceanica, Strain CCMP 410" /LENGTH=514 /DNA_ID=CAMNT_0038693309 /DNA_START=184 /DNA_END=1728 /DNA_ORIENTATION=-
MTNPQGGGPINEASSETMTGDKEEEYKKQQLQLRHDAAKQMAIRHAAAVAAASLEKKLQTTNSTTSTVLWTRQLTEFQKCSLQSELAFLDILLQMNNEGRLRTLFLLFDTDAGGTVSSQEMARCLKKMDTGKTFSESLDAAVLSVQAFDRDGDGVMDVVEFAEFVDDLVESLACTFEDLCQFLTLRVAFADSGAGVLDDAIVAFVQDSTTNNSGNNNAGMSIDSFNDAVVEVRMILLWQMMDDGGGRGVEFEAVVKALFHVTQHMDESPRKALLMCADNSSRNTLDYDQFSSLLLNVVAAGSLNFHDVANSMTLSICKNDVTRTDLKDLFVGDEIYKTALAEQQGGSAVADYEILDALQYGRLNRLFDLWDLDHSNTLEFSELVLGMRKFHEAKEVDKTVEESVEAFLAFDDNNDQVLDRQEFATLLAQFARAARVPLHELIDFMVVTSAVKDNSSVEQAYIESVKSRAGEQLKQKNNNTKATNTNSNNNNNPQKSIGALWKGLYQRGNSSSNH